MKNIYKYIPNTLTSLNLISGFIAIILAFNVNYLSIAAYFIFIAVCFDFTDGLAARVLNAYSEFGKQLDSLADAISFGVAPGVFAFHLLEFSSANINDNSSVFLYAITLAAIIPLFSVFRLAKFNIDTRQNNSFRGLPTPASAIFFASLVIIVLNLNSSLITNIILNTYVLTGIIIADALLMICDLPMFALKMKTLAIKDNIIQYSFIILSVVLFVAFQLLAIPLIIIVYILISLLLWIKTKLLS